LTRDYPASARRILARQVAINSFILLIASFLVGTHILGFFGISIPVVQVGGGLIVISNGWALLKSKEEVDRSREVQKKMNLKNISRSAFYPLTLPLTVGPFDFHGHHPRGERAPSTWPEPSCDSRCGHWFGACGREHLPLLRLRPSSRAMIGETGMSIILRLSSFLLVCIGVQIFWNGASALLRSLPLGVR